MNDPIREIGQKMKITGGRRLVDINRAGAGVRGIARVLIMHGAQKESLEGSPLDEFTVGELAEGLEALAELIDDRSEELLEWLGLDALPRPMIDRAAAGVSDGGLPGGVDNDG
jgi:hypothetical protein